MHIYIFGSIYIFSISDSLELILLKEKIRLTFYSLPRLLIFNLKRLRNIVPTGFKLKQKKLIENSCKKSLCNKTNSLFQKLLSSENQRNIKKKWSGLVG